MINQLRNAKLPLMEQTFKLNQPTPIELEEIENELLKNFIRLKKADNKKMKTF